VQGATQPVVPLLGTLLTGSERAALHASGTVRRWAAGEVIVRRGDRSDSAMVLLRGFVKVHTLAAGGHDVVLGVLGPGELFGETSAVATSTRSATASAIGEAETLVVSAAALQAFLAEHPRVAHLLLELLVARLLVADRRRMEFANSTSLERVAGRIVELAERFGGPGEAGVIEIPVPLAQEDLASWSASSLESTARALRTLRQLRVIATARRRIAVLDLDGLVRRAAQL
jgi:CRP/FNR family cyclic AMP-dependent transcriptional regulator